MAPRCTRTETPRNPPFALALDALTDVGQIVAAEARGALSAQAHRRLRLQLRAERLARYVQPNPAPSLRARAWRLVIR